MLVPGSLPPVFVSGLSLVPAAGLEREVRDMARAGVTRELTE